MSVDRAALRRELRSRRRGLSASDRIAAAERVSSHLLALPFAPASGYVAGYWAMDAEIALHVWQLRLPDTCIYCLPVLADDRLRFAPWRPGDALATNRYGIPEPDVAPSSLLDAGEMSLVVAPLVGFDVRGNRLGMGAGWYDSTFAFRQQQSAPPWLVGAAFDVQRLDQVAAAAWDIPLDAVCTDSTTYDCVAARSAGPA